MIYPKINLIHPEKSDVKYELTTFPDGEPHIKLDELDRKVRHDVYVRITNPNDLFVLMQVNNILTRQGISWSLNISYLMSQRMDRVITFEEAFSLEIVMNILKGFSCNSVNVYEPHSPITVERLGGDRFYADICHPGIADLMSGNCVICYPDAGARDRYHDMIWTDCNETYILLDKKRDLQNITNLEFVRGPEKATRIVVSDDLCDAGGTFVLASAILRKKYPDAKLDIVVRHMVNPIGIKNLSEHYDDVYFTNSYKDWDNLPNNCHLISVYDENNI
jgi:ribose-phosphate pyrophosphokinase